MAKYRKVIRSKYMYRKETHKVRNTILFLLLVILLIGFGYIVSKALDSRTDRDAPSESSPPISSVPVSSVPVSLPITSDPAAATDLGGILLSPENAAKTGDSLTALLQEMRDAGYTDVAVDLKTEDGVVTFDSNNALAKEWNTISETPISLDEFVRTARSLGLSPVARISALKDPTAHASRENTFGYGGDPMVTWLDMRVDLGGKAWMNPYMENARNYISGLCKEAAERGFDRILLTNVNFPTTVFRDKMGLLNETTTQEGILEQLMLECRTAAGGVDVYNGYDLARYASENIRPVGMDCVPIINMDAVASAKESICANYGCSPQALMTEIVDRVLQQLPDAKLAVIRQADLAELRPVLEQNGITEWILMP